MMIFFLLGVESWTANAGWRWWGWGTHLRWATLSWFWNFKFRIRCPLETAFLRLRGDGNLGIGEIRLLFVLFCQKNCGELDFLTTTIFYSFVLSRRLHGLDNLCAKCGALWTHTRLLPHGCSVQALLYWKGWAYGYGFALNPIQKYYIFGLMFYWLNNATGMVVGSLNFFKLRLGWIRDQVIGQTHIINHNKIEIM